MKIKFTILAVATAALLGVTGCGSSDNFVALTGGGVGGGGGPALLAPVAVDDNVTALGNATLNQTADNGVLTNDTVNGASITDFDGTTAQGGTVVLNDDGSFTYTPAAGFTGTDTFTYTLGNTLGISTATVTVNVPNEGFFVDNQAAAGGNGSQTNPFNNIPDGLNAAGNGDVVFVDFGNGTAYPGGFNVPPGVDLIGQGTGLILAQTVVAPGQATEIDGGITLGGDNTVAGFLFTGNTDAITAANVSNLDINNNTFQTADQDQVRLDNIGGTVSVTNNAFEISEEDVGFDFDNLNTDVTLVVSDNTFGLLATGNMRANDAIQVDFRGSTTATFTAERNAVNGNFEDNNQNFDDGIDIEVEDNANVTANLNDNQILDIKRDGIEIDVNSSNSVNNPGAATLNVNASGNLISGITEEDGFDIEYYDNSVGTIDLMNNTVDGVDSDEDCLDLESRDNSNVTLLLTGNTFTRATDGGVDLRAQQNSNLECTMVNNTFTRNENYAMEMRPTGDATACLNASGNTFDNDEVTLRAGNNGVFNVTDLANFENNNTFINGATFNTIEMDSGQINSQVGGCGTP
jgi:hypothetical protein